MFFVGVNNHRENILFASAFLANETSESYEWLLRTFLFAMKWKKPISVLTDSDEGISCVIYKILPDCHHWLCASHVEKNAKDNLQIPERVALFKSCMYALMRPEEFELRWQHMLETFGFQNDDWMETMHVKKERWAIAFLVDSKVFNALKALTDAWRISWTQRFEAI